MKFSKLLLLIPSLHPETPFFEQPPVHRQGGLAVHPAIPSLLSDFCPPGPFWPDSGHSYPVSRQENGLSSPVMRPS